MAKGIRKVRQLEIYLQQLTAFESPKVGLEQYQTTPHIAAHVLWEIESYFTGIKEKAVLDLGCGTGTLGIGCLLLGAKKVVGIDIDQNAIDIALKNVRDLELDEDDITFIQKDVQQLTPADLGGVQFDMVVMNPPFGTKDHVAIDAVFVQKALSLVDTVYSMHKTSTREFWEKKQKEWNMIVKPQTQIVFNLDACYDFHRELSRDIEVDLLQFTRRAQRSV